jgi:hypothetical protein
MDADNSNKPAQTPGLNPRIRGERSKACHHTQIVKKLGGPPAPGINRKTTTPAVVGEKRETKLPNKRKKVNLKSSSGEGSINTAFGGYGVGSGPGALASLPLGGSGPGMES